MEPLHGPNKTAGRGKEHAVAGPGPTIVVADDEPDIRRLVGFALRRGGYTVLEAATGTAALALIRRRRPALALLDVHMPGLDGIDVVRALAADPDLAGVPILLLSASAQAADVQVGLQAGATAYMVKPFAPAELVAKVAALLGLG